jgi:hypothetical protein
MDTQELIKHAQALRQRIQAYGRDSEHGPPRAGGAKAQVCDFLRAYTGPKSSFVAQAEAATGYDGYQVGQLTAVLDSFIEYLEAGLHSSLSPERRAQIDVVSDMLEQANSLLENKDCHPAAAAVLVGASLEEFLRNWVEAEGLSIGSSKPGIDAYCKSLRSAELIQKQDAKDITAWAGIRNHSAHGEWDQVSDRDRIRLMLEGVNLFMRQKTA